MTWIPHKKNAFVRDGMSRILNDKTTIDVTANHINGILYKVHSLLMFGSCSLNLYGITCGRLDTSNMIRGCGWGGFY